MDLDRARLARAAVAGAAQRSCPEVVQADGDPDMGVGGAESVCAVEGDPAKLRDVGLGPGVAGILLAHPVVAMEIAADIACRNSEAAAGRDEDVAEILAN